MPIYHFNVHDGQDFPDPDGTDLSGVEAARSHALRYAADLLAEVGDRFWTGEPWTMDVTDDHGLTLFRLEFAAHDAPSLGTSRN
jgi:hypothetical protein